MSANCLQVNFSGKHSTFAWHNGRSMPKRSRAEKVKRVSLTSLADDFVPKRDNFKLTVQTQDELIRQFLRQDDKTTDSRRQLQFPCRSGLIRPINVHLLTGSSLKNSCSVANLVSDTFIGRSTSKKHAGKNQIMRSKRTARQNVENLETLRREIEKTKTKVVDSVICCQQFPGLFEDKQSQTLFKTSKPDFGRYRPWSRFLWFINSECEPYMEAKPTRQDSEFSETKPTLIREKRDHLRKSSLLSQRSSHSLSKRSSSHLRASTAESDAENPLVEPDDGEEFDGAESVSSEPKNVETGGAIQLTASDNEYIESYNREYSTSVDADAIWIRSKKPAHRSWKTDRCMKTDRLSGTNLYTDQLLRSQSVYQYDRNAVLMASLASDNKRAIRRLLLSLSQECDPILIYERYRRNGRITFSADEYAASYGPNTLRCLKIRWKNMLGSSKPIINDNLIMRLLQKRLDEIRRSDLTRLEQELQAKETQRFQNLLRNHVGDQELVKSELLKEGELCHQRRRQDPVILQRRQFNQPVFGLNPFKEFYRASHLDVTEMPAEKLRRPMDAEVTTSMKKYNRKNNKKTNRHSGKLMKTMQFHPLDLRKPDFHSGKPPWKFYDEDIGSPHDEDESFEVVSTLNERDDVVLDQDMPNQDGNDHHEKYLIKKLPIPPVSIESCLLTSSVDSGELDNSSEVQKMYVAAKRLLNLGSSTDQDSQLPKFVTADSQATLQGENIGKRIHLTDVSSVPYRSMSQAIYTSYLLDSSRKAVTDQHRPISTSSFSNLCAR